MPADPGAAMRIPRTTRAHTKRGQRAFALCLGALIASLVAAGSAESEEFPIALVAPGMNQTELQSVLGPPTYIQVKHLRQAWQYCPRRFFIRFLDPYVREEPLVFVTVWFDNGQVQHMRAYPSERMGECEDFLAAFRWEDDLGGVFEYEGGGQRIK
jgi:hypothetical protein